MIGLMLIAVNERERQILEMAFKQHGISITLSKPSYANYIKTLQYMPDVIIMEMPKMSADQFHFANMVRKNKKTRKIPIIGYGDKITEGEQRVLAKNGVSDYIVRPLKFSLLLRAIQKYLRILNKSIDAIARPESEKDADLARILSGDASPSTTIDLMTKHISGLVAFPFTVAKILQLTGSDKSGANDLAKVIEADPAITAGILKMSNTVFFASLNRAVSSIKDAVVRIGFRETKRIVMAMSVIDLLGKTERSMGFNRKDFWIHSLATALIAEKIAVRVGGVNVEEAFLAGLLHDFGILLLDEFFPPVFTKVMEETTNTGTGFFENEKKTLGITHNDLVGALFKKWKIPDAITDAIVSHYGAAEPRTAQDLPAACVHIGNQLAKIYCFGTVCDQCIRPLENSLFDAMKMPAGPGKNFFAAISHDLDTYKKLLGIKEEKSVTAREEKKHIGVYCAQRPYLVPVEEYLKVQGHACSRITQSDTYDSYDGQFDAIIVWAGAETTRASLTPLCAIAQRAPDDASAGGKPAFAPVLALVYRDSPLAAEKPKKIACMYNECDLRQFDDALSKLLEKKPVTP